MVGKNSGCWEICSTLYFEQFSLIRDFSILILSINLISGLFVVIWIKFYFKFGYFGWILKMFCKVEVSWDRNFLSNNTTMLGWLWQQMSVYHLGVQITLLFINEYMIFMVQLKFGNSCDFSQIFQRFHNLWSKMIKEFNLKNFLLFNVDVFELILFLMLKLNFNSIQYSWFSSFIVDFQNWDSCGHLEQQFASSNCMYHSVGSLLFSFQWFIECPRCLLF